MSQNKSSKRATRKINEESNRLLLKSLDTKALGVLKLLEPNQKLIDFFETQSKIEAVFESYKSPLEEYFKRVELVTDTLNSLPFNKIEKSMQSLVAMQNTFAKSASRYQSFLSSTVFKSGITQLTNALSNIKVEAFTGLYITSEFKEHHQTNHHGIAESTTVKQSKLITGAQLQVDIEKNTNTNLEANIVYQRIDHIEAKLNFMDKNLSSTKEDTQIIKSMLENERGLIHVLKNNPFPYFKIASIEFHKGKSLLKVNNEISIQLPQYSMIENICTILFSDIQELGEEWYEDSIKGAWASLIGNEEAERISWKQILRAVSDLNTHFAKKTTKDDLIIIERPKRIRLNPKYF